MEYDPRPVDLKREREEQELIKKGGLHPAPWEAREDFNGKWRVVDANECTLARELSKPVAKVIAESFNRYPVVVLEDDVVY